MDSVTIALSRKWKCGAVIAEGGFGRVYEAEADDGSRAVVKLVPKERGAARELLFESVSGSNIIPILDTGEWRDYYVLVMPRAETALRQHLNEVGGKLTLDTAVPILTDVAEALASLTNAVVHRDLKPENVLLYQGKWCLADFGIARYAGATTAPDTHKFSMTPAYAAPEQWREERATAATDVYAFGVMAFEMLEGHRPFPGPTAPDFRAQHLNQPPPALTGCPPWLASLVTECMYKASAARPSASNILARLRASQQSPSSAAARLQAINQRFVAKQAEEEAKASEQRSVEHMRASLLAVGEQSLRQIQETLIERILDAVPTANVTRGLNPFVRFENARLAFDAIRPAPPKALASHEAARFDVIAFSAISVRKSQDRSGYEGRSHSLWYCDAQEKGVYRWFEMAFMQVFGGSSNVAPFALPPEQAGIVFSNVAGTRQLARRPRPFDQGDEEQFIERWIDWFASAVEGTLHYPPRLPED